MTTWFVSRHPGALDWIKSKGLQVDKWIKHLDTSLIEPGDTVIGTLSMEAAATVCRKGARFIAIELNLSESMRGKELTSDTLNQIHCKLTEFCVRRVGNPFTRD